MNLLKLVRTCFSLCVCGWLWVKYQKVKVTVALRLREEYFPHFSNCCFKFVHVRVLNEKTCDKLCRVFSGAAGSREQDLDSGADLGVAARCLSCIADVLVCMAGGRGGLRSGPAANEAWSVAYHLLEEGNLRGGVHALAAQRALWLSRWASGWIQCFHVGWCSMSCYPPSTLHPPGQTCWFGRLGTTKAPDRCCSDRLWCHHRSSSASVRVKSRLWGSGRKWSVQPDWTWQVSPVKISDPSLLALPDAHHSTWFNVRVRCWGRFVSPLLD